MSCIVDASVAVKFYIEEAGHEQAVRLLHGSQRLMAPAMLLAELGNVLWKKVRLREISLEQAAAIDEDFQDELIEIVPLEELHDRALALCLDLDHPIYDCYYLALSEREDLPLVTTDRRLLAIGGEDRRWHLRELSG
ncbi:Predicted nucleic acid-binding protein, contains PIN domain [Tistlia consotensis]|uniref:Ribonuclease VapC n=1 Tax=Tistlia consotensis USBA 355 TaxID=560819 RepID=A0A1Y6BQD3_9PROT|nr:type II toxin-antitoxin system VapC family toxin [Tistlia consotensis]SMF23615.1 Predicted nucleic acid-binding protein, contains PIN domain [Tistlia consotensis USBA 355]SNR61443.1 Predicted nucleic acid-binding protein, contains PIN domain [Tistlia consotensis]